jgi:hypothetical protein
MVPKPGEGVSLPGSNDLRARERSWACHYLAPLTFEPGEELGGLPYIPLLLLRCPTHKGGSSHSF